MIEFSIALLIKFLIILVFGFLSGLELREYLYSKQEPLSIGTTRTFTFISLLGFITNIISQNLFIVGFFVLSLFMLIFYLYKINKNKKGILQILISLIVYSFAPLADISIFFIPLIYVSIVFIVSSKPKIYSLMEKIDNEEILIFSKFLILSVVILPILPKDNVIPYVSISPFKIWIAVVVVSTISYISYILQKYFLSNSGIIVTGILGGIYSSTATTVVLAKKQSSNLIQATIIIATGVMYLRLLIIIGIFNLNLAKDLLFEFMGMFLLSVVIFFFLKDKNCDKNEEFNSNPLEIEVAFIFAGLFIIMAAITQFITTNFGNLGLQLLSTIIGFTDIDPFILSLVQGKYDVNNNDLINAILIAVASNNILKAIYTGMFSNWKMKKASVGLLILSIITVGFTMI